MSLPSITVIGTVTADPELQFGASGTARATFTVAANERRFNKSTQAWEDGSTTFIRCTAWRQEAEHVAESITRGMRVFVMGRFKQRDVERDGQKRTFYDLDVEEVGPTLKWATVKVNKASRDSAQRSSAGSDDAWATGPADDSQAPF